mgnify:CR=1 FL=1
MELEQQKSNVVKELTDVKAALDTFDAQHDKLRLHDIEYVVTLQGKEIYSPTLLRDDSDDSDDEDEEERAEAMDADGDEDVKPKKKKDELTLKTYSVDELRKHKREALLADTELLDGQPVPWSFSCLKLTWCFDRTNQECKSRPYCPQGVQETRGRVR